MNKLYLSFLLAFIDQISKFYIREKLEVYDSIEIIAPGILNFTFVENRNIAFGLDLGFVNQLVVWISILIVIAIFYLVVIEIDESNFRSYGMPFILGGAIGNTIDRLCVFLNFPGYYGVTDFFDMPNLLYYFGIMENSRWFIFNIADIAISIGAVIFVLSSLTIFEKYQNSSESTLV